MLLAIKKNYVQLAEIQNTERWSMSSYEKKISIP